MTIIFNRSGYRENATARGSVVPSSAAVLARVFLGFVVMFAVAVVCARCRACLPLLPFQSAPRPPQAPARSRRAAFGQYPWAGQIVSGPLQDRPPVPAATGKGARLWHEAGAHQTAVLAFAKC